MTYTLWSHGRLLGTTDLAWARSLPRQRAGDIAPTPIGATLLPVACGVRPALRRLYRAGTFATERTGSAAPLTLAD